jgi:hypothetical protein
MMVDSDHPRPNMWRKKLASALHRNTGRACATYWGAPHSLWECAARKLVALFEQVAESRRTIAAQAEEIARLKGGPRRPNIKPSGMEKATEPKPDKPGGEGHGKRGSTKSKLTIHEEKTVKADAPAGSRFKGYTSFVVQDLVVRAHVTNFRCRPGFCPHYSKNV